MSLRSRSQRDPTDELPLEMQQLAAAIAQLPPDQREQLQPFLERVAAGTRRRRRILLLVQDALSQLRLDMRYLTFDLEATRRERDTYRRRANENDQPGGQDPDWPGFDDHAGL